VANEKGRNKKKKEQKKKDRLFRLVGTDLCACSGGHQSKCDGVCREAHTNSKTGIVKCGEMYQIDQSENSRRPKRDWKFGKQKEVKDNKESKQERRQKRERDRYDG
jgi:hypothetical protein